jgi:hypothetical protein
MAGASVKRLKKKGFKQTACYELCKNDETEFEFATFANNSFVQSVKHFDKSNRMHRFRNQLRVIRNQKPVLAEAEAAKGSEAKKVLFSAMQF